MSTFIDTSALLAVLDADDQNHPMAKQAWENLVANESDLVCKNYVLVETFALVQSRLGLEAVRTFQEDIVPLLRIEWIDAQSHASGVAALLIAAGNSVWWIAPASMRCGVWESRPPSLSIVILRSRASTRFRSLQLLRACRPSGARSPRRASISAPSVCDPRRQRMLQQINGFAPLVRLPSVDPSVDTPGARPFEPLMH